MERLGGVLGGSWGYLGASWTLLEAFSASPRDLRGIMGGIGGTLEGLLEPLGDVLGLSWGMLGSSWGVLGRPWMLPGTILEIFLNDFVAS